jgi:hypothetical protein
MASSLGGTPGDGMLMRASDPASVREAPLSTAAIANNRRACATCFACFANRRTSSAA